MQRDLLRGAQWMCGKPEARMIQGMPVGSLLKLGGKLGLRVGSAYTLLTKSESWSREVLDAYRSTAFIRLMEHCYDHVPYYRRIMDARRIGRSDLRSVHDLALLPFLTKEDIRREGIALRSDMFPDRVCQFRRSGGTTGEPIRVAFDARARAFANAAYVRGFRWMGYELGKPLIRLFGGSLGIKETATIRSRFRELLFNSSFLPAFELSEENVDHYVRKIGMRQDAVLVGYASVIHHLVLLAKKQGIALPPLRSIICTAEELPGEWRASISNAFRCPVYAYYGCGEINSIGYEHPKEKGYIVSQEQVVLEATQGDSSTFREEGKGVFAITTLHNYAMPLIRYINGDHGSIGYAPTGMPHQRIFGIEGRMLDGLFTVQGDWLSGALIPHMILKSKAPVSKWQVVQHSLSTFSFHYHTESGAPLSDESCAVLRAIMTEHLGGPLRIDFIPGSFIVPVSGKHRFVVNLYQSGKPALPIAPGAVTERP